MTKAEMKTKDGTTITISGDPDEVVRILSQLGGDLKERRSIGKPTVKTTQKKEAKIDKITMADLVEELKQEGFFDTGRSLVEIKNAFAQRGHIFGIENISTPVLRCVRRRELGRIKEGKKWVYVKR